MSCRREAIERCWVWEARPGRQTEWGDGTGAMMGDTRKRGSERVTAKVTGCAAAREVAVEGAAQMKRPAASRQNAWGRRRRGRARRRVGGLTVEGGPARAAQRRRRNVRPPFACRVQGEGRGRTLNAAPSGVIVTIGQVL